MLTVEPSLYVRLLVSSTDFYSPLVLCTLLHERCRTKIPGHSALQPQELLLKREEKLRRQRKLSLYQLRIRSHTSVTSSQERKGDGKVTQLSAYKVSLAKEKRYLTRPTLTNCGTKYVCRVMKRWNMLTNGCFGLYGPPGGDLQPDCLADRPVTGPRQST
eukprot:1137365-Pelagomonas_calceolata.AAC.5